MLSLQREHEGTLLFHQTFNFILQTEDKDQSPQVDSQNHAKKMSSVQGGSQQEQEAMG